MEEATGPKDEPQYSLDGIAGLSRLESCSACRQGMLVVGAEKLFFVPNGKEIEISDTESNSCGACGATYQGWWGRRIPKRDHGFVCFGCETKLNFKMVPNGREAPKTIEFHCPHCNDLLKMVLIVPVGAAGKTHSHSGYYLTR